VDSSAGNVLVLGHVQNGIPFVTTNSHLESWIVRAGNTVRAGARVATIGNTGRSFGKHLHFELMFKPFTFKTATYGRSDPNPYIIEGLAAQGSITPQEDELSATEVKEIKDFVFVTVNTMLDRFHTATRKNVIGELSKKIESSEYDVQKFLQEDGENRHVVTREQVEEAFKAHQEAEGK
jgi:murein DD-endopeptidase MepM/ murein hydrolase activator NlpD